MARKKEYYVIVEEDLVFKTGKGYMQTPDYYAKDIKDARLFPSKEVAEEEVRKLKEDSSPAFKFWIEKVDEYGNILEVFDKMKVYLVGFFEDYKSVCEFFSNIDLIPENKLVEHVKVMIDEEQICPETIEDGGYDIENMDVPMAIKILENDGYTIKEYNI